MFQQKFHQFLLGNGHMCPNVLFSFFFFPDYLERYFQLGIYSSQTASNINFCTIPVSCPIDTSVSNIILLSLSTIVSSVKFRIIFGIRFFHIDTSPYNSRTSEICRKCLVVLIYLFYLQLTGAWLKLDLYFVIFSNPVSFIFQSHAQFVPIDKKVVFVFSRTFYNMPSSQNHNSNTALVFI